MTKRKSSSFRLHPFSSVLMDYGVSGAKIGRRLLPISPEDGISAGFQNIILY
jgi:hypothetical protein